MTVLSLPIRFCQSSDMLIMHYFNDKPFNAEFCTQYGMSEQIDPMSRKSMLERSVINKKWRPEFKN